MQVTDKKFNPSNSDDITKIKEAGEVMQGVIEKHAPAGRRRSVALTNLETALMYAVKAAAVGDE